MKKLFPIIFILLFAFVAHAQTQSEEAIISFAANITVNTDNSISVTEKIVYNTGPEEHHGIYRDIYPYSSLEMKMDIQDVKVFDENGEVHEFEVSRSKENVGIKIGDPDTTFSGEETYIISYRATKAVAQFETFDEIYWNVTGNDWGMPIYSARATVRLPENEDALQSACYFGPEGSTATCNVSTGGAAYAFISPALSSHEGFTLALGFQKGIVEPYPPIGALESFLTKYFGLLVGILLPFITFIISIWYWYKNGRDPKGTGVIIPQYEVPEKLTPMEVQGIIDENVGSNAISAEIIYLATKGYLRINELEEKMFGFIKTKDYELVKQKDFSDLPHEFDGKLLESMLGDKSSVKLSELQNVFYQHVPTITTGVLDTLLLKKYYSNLGITKNRKGRLIILLFVIIWISAIVSTILNYQLLDGSPLPIIIGIVLSLLIYGIITHFSPAKTEKGIALYEHLLGLKLYLQIAEKDRIEFHNAPKKKPEIFEHFLPYAMVMGVADIWAKEFEGIYTTPPDWYHGASSSNFNAVIFANSLSDFSTSASTSLTSAPGGGSGGGGSSGGGGGGGGGGSW